MKCDYEVQFTRAYYKQCTPVRDSIIAKLYMTDDGVILQIPGQWILLIGDQTGAVEVYKEIEKLYLTY